MLYYTTNRIRIASANHEIYLSENGPSRGAAVPTPADPPKKKSRSAPFGSRRRAARKLNQNKTKFEERTGQCMVATSAEDNTRRAIERGSLPVVERTLEETKEELVKNKKTVEESQAQPRCRRRRRRRCCCCFFSSSSGGGKCLRGFTARLLPGCVMRHVF
ncbi:unnamed protein product [Ectocarpus sp. CCAP 1310/34]|nr:unnamed protein product [Ectocarpus sp. CCAP 1310/34]